MNFKVGEIVKYNENEEQGKVIAIDGDEIIVKFNGGGIRPCLAINLLKVNSEDISDSEKIDEIYQMMKELTEKVNSLEANFDAAISGAKHWLLEKGPTLPIFGTFIKQAMRK